MSIFFIPSFITMTSISLENRYLNYFIPDTEIRQTYTDNDKMPQSTYNMGVGCGKAGFWNCTCLVHQLVSQHSLHVKFLYGHVSFILVITSHVPLSFVLKLKYYASNKSFLQRNYQWYSIKTVGGSQLTKWGSYALHLTSIILKDYFLAGKEGHRHNDVAKCLFFF